MDLELAGHNRAACVCWQGRAGQGLTGIHHDITAELALRKRYVEGSDPAVRIQNARCVDHHAVVPAAVHLYIARSYALLFGTIQCSSGAEW